MRIAPYPQETDNTSAMVSWGEYERVCRERDHYKNEAEQKAARIRELEAVMSCPNLTGEQVRRLDAVVRTLRKAKPDKVGSVSPDVLEFMRTGGISTALADNTKKAKKRSWKNAMTNDGALPFPVHSIDESGMCTCPNANCTDQGKHACWKAGLIEHGCSGESTDWQHTLPRDFTPEQQAAYDRANHDEKTSGSGPSSTSGSSSTIRTSPVPEG